MYTLPYGPVRESQRDKPLTEAERGQRVKALQAEQEKRLRKALGDDLFEWIEDFEQDADVLSRE